MNSTCNMNMYFKINTGYDWNILSVFLKSTRAGNCNALLNNSFSTTQAMAYTARLNVFCKICTDLHCIVLHMRLF